MGDSHIKTSKGTELPILNLKGKPYLQVPHRIVWFREDHPDWLISVSFANITEDLAMARAEILDESGKLRAVAHKVEHRAHFADYVEKAETGSIGRALAMIGYGTQFAEEFFEGDRLADAPTKPAIKPQKQSQQEAPPPPAKEQKVFEVPDKPLTALEKMELGKFVIPGGPFKGKKLGEVPYDDLMHYKVEQEGSFSKTPEKMSPGLRDLLNRISAYYLDYNPA